VRGWWSPKDRPVSCTKFSVENSVSTAVAGNKTMPVTVKVNDADVGGGLVRYLLANSSVECRLDNNNYSRPVWTATESSVPVDGRGYRSTIPSANSIDTTH